MTNAQQQFDVFLAHNSQDKAQVKEIARELKGRGLNPWLDEEQIQPGQQFREKIQEVIPLVKAAVIFCGLKGLGRWQNLEIGALMTSCLQRNIPLIPVLLPGVSKLPEEELFLQQFQLISFSTSDDDHALKLLEWAITGERSTQFSNSDKKPGRVPTSNDVSSAFQMFGLNIAKYTIKRLFNNWLLNFLVEKFLLYQQQDDRKLTKIEYEKFADEITKQDIVTKTIQDLLQHFLQENNEDSGSAQQLRQVLSEIKILLKQLLIFLFSSAKKRLPETNNETEKDVNQLANQIEKFSKDEIDKKVDDFVELRRKKIVAERPRELKPVTSSRTDNTPLSNSQQTHESKSPGAPNKKPSLENPESKKMLENLHKYKEYGESVLRVLKSLESKQSSANEILDNLKVKDCLKSLKDAANNTVKLASSPVKIAVMGEFSSGKTLLIGNLIGYADALPISEIPTTGNVTAIHLLQQEDFKTTEFHDFIVEYFSPAEVKQCLEFMLEEAKKRAQASELLVLPQVNSETLDRDTLNRYENWCKQAWNQTQNLDLRYLLLELIIFIRAYVAYGADLCDKSFTITHTTAREGLKLTPISAANQDITFEDIPEVLKLPVDKNRPSPELLQNSFSLIRRVNINVKISEQIWNLGTTQDTAQDTAKFILLDFPGLGAADSGVRDTFVSLQELEEVQTILILLNGITPGNDRANKIFNMIQQKRPKQNLKDFILVGVGRFNELRIEQQKLNQLIDNAANKPLIETTIFQEFSSLKTIIDQASALTNQKDRIVLLDQQIGLADLAKVSTTVKVGSQEFLAKLEDQNDSSIQQSKRMREKWQSLSGHLLATDTHSSLGKQLRDFAQEGGILKLRELILNHVAAHSLKQLYEDTRREGEELRKQQNQLKQILSELGIATEESPALKELRDAIEKIYRTYNRFKDNLGKEPLKNATGDTISEVIKDEVTYKIHEWKQWNLLFNRAQNGIIALPSTTEPKKPFLKRTPVNIPTKSDDFYEVFEKTVKELKFFAEDCMKKAVNNLLQNLSNQLSPEIDQLKAKLREDMETEIKEKFADEQADIFFALYQGYNPDQWQEYIMQTSQEEQSTETVTVFPLAHKDEKHDSGQFLDWAPEYSTIQNQTPNQILLVQRLRDEITASISLHTIEYASQINKKVERAILQILDDLIPELYALLRQEALLRYIAGEKQEINEADSVSRILSQIPSIATPDIAS